MGFLFIYFLREQRGQMKLTERIVCAHVCVRECACVGTLLLCISDVLCCSEGGVQWVFELAHLQCQQLPSNYRQPALTHAFETTDGHFSLFAFSVFFFVWSESDVIKHE